MAQKKRSRKRDRDAEAPGWVWMLFGLAVGLAVALGVYINAGREIRSIREPGVAAAEPGADADSSLSEADPTAPAARTTPADSPGSRFDFYELLPRFEVVVPEIETPEPRRLRDEAIEEPGLYVLQAGSFLSLADADQRKASLALLGIESRIQTVAIDDETFHRVRVGPIGDLGELNQYRRRLLDADVETLVMRLPD